MKETVLCYIEFDNKYLLLFRNKKEIDINKGKYIGIGGHIENGETKEQALIREVKEETGFNLISYKYKGKVFFKDNDYSEIMHLFYSNEFNGELIECDEGTLCWIEKDDMKNIPQWDGDKYFLELMENEANYFEMELIYHNGELISHKRIK